MIYIKFAAEWLLSLTLVFILSPLLLTIFLAIKLEDRGPVIFRQFRVGKDLTPFRIFKFRSMVVDADQYLNEDGSVKDVNRITKVGKVLRKTSLDELPQLLNILKGEMSLVGPRPGLVEQLDNMTNKQKKRYDMRPGITGLAQVNGRNKLPWSKRIEYDLEYVRNYSLLLDLKILVKTVRVVLLGEGMVMDRNPSEVADFHKK